MNILCHTSRLPQKLRPWITLVKNYTADNKKMIIEPLDRRQIVRVNGDDAISFLQGLTTNDMRQLEMSTETSLYTMFLNKAGRVLYDAIMYRTSTDPTTILIECDKEVVSELIKHLKLYRVRRKIQIDSVADEYTVWSSFGGSTHKPKSTNDIIITDDPRLSFLGQRIVLTTNQPGQLPKLYTEAEILESSKGDYQQHRYKIGVAEGALDMPPGKQFPLEANCDILNGVSFNKGCYIGQELTARVHHTGVIRKRHMPVILTAPLESNSSKSIVNETDTKIGNILGSIGNKAIGLLRIEKVLKSKELLIDGKPCYVEKPSWWPQHLLVNVSSKDEV
ncbi:iron-sulfur cluster assembly factor IBA57, mitochondrial [Haematobia irritans]|uniref:iron-sulfur cluster assembly factor IBA57, mitochondrial n=1 Tax=Haematobia irritans TaxID=7368 RepID=UPI003F4F7DF8